MLRRVVAFLLAIACSAAIGLPAFAQGSGSTKFSGGFYERIRHEFWKNNRDMENRHYDGGDRNFFRFKTSVWGQMDYEQYLTAYLKITNEIKGYNFLGSGNRKVYSNNHQHWDPDEVVVDNLYIDLKKPGGIPVDFRIGRQDLIGQYGEGFLISDGTPGDGSRTLYFNAVKAAWAVNDENTFDMIYTNNPRDEMWLPVLNEDKSPVNLNLTAEEGWIFYLKNKSVKNLAFEPYYIYKREDSDYGSGLQSKKSRLNTLGFFTKYNMAPLTFRFQIADQFGTYGDADRQGHGGYFFTDYDMKDIAMKPQLTAGFVYLSGDNKNTVKNEGWNPLFCKFPVYSEIYSQAFQYESGNSYWTNVQLYRLGVTLKPADPMKFNLAYSFLRANELVSANAAYNISGSGKDRGHLIQSKLDYVFNKNVSSYLLGEYFIPCRGRFYTKDADPAVLVRTQIEMKF